MKFLLPAATVLFLFARFDSAMASGGSCTCEAEELGFTIDCSNTQAMTSALTFLKTNGCSTDCSSEDCERAFYIVQSHHDYCPEAGLPTGIEDDFHDFDTSCVACDIERSFVEGAPDCPLVDCSTNAGNEAYSRLLTNSCLTDCSSTECGNDYLTLVSFHESCDHNDLSRAAEGGIHDMEEVCTMHACNYASGDDNQLKCEDSHDHDHSSNDDESGGAGATVTSVTFLGVSAAAVSVMMV